MPSDHQRFYLCQISGEKMKGGERQFQDPRPVLKFFTRLRNFPITLSFYENKIKNKNNL